ncbi:MAG: hypothetical protein ACRENU_01440 [Gemmatimonadaceae bacterium]
MRFRRLNSLGLSLALLGCLSSTSPSPPLIGEGRPVLFVGNSYLYWRDIPGIVQSMADSAGGDKLAVMSVVGPDMALIDHWNVGTVQEELGRHAFEWVVLQQGPSSVEVNRDTLRLAAKLFADEMAKVGNAKPALFSAWPGASRRQDFPRAIESYTLAASDVSGIFLPVASGWLAAWERDANLGLYSDALHPSTEGAYLSALVIYARLLNKSPVGLPSTLRLASGAVVTIAPAVAATLQQAAAAVASPPP